MLWKFEHRRRFIVSLRTSRIDSTELKGMLDAREPVALFDLRNRLSIDSDPQKIMGAQIVSLEEIDERHSEIPRDREIILYCN